MIEFLLNHPMIYVLADVLLHSLWQCTAIAVLLWALLLITKKLNANVRYLISCLALAAIVLIPVLTFATLTPKQSAGQLNIQTSEVSTDLISNEVIPQPNSQVSLEQLEPTLLVNTTQQTIQQRIQGLPFRMFLPWLVLVWFIGIVVCSLRLLGSWVVVERLKTQGVALSTPQLQQKLLSLSKKLNIRKPIRLFDSSNVTVPMVIGYLRPVILLPTSTLTGLSTAQLELIIAHELAHIKRHDSLINGLQHLLETLFFYHPAVWWVSKQIRIEREHCCDDLAIKLTNSSAVDYVETLAQLEHIRQQPQFVLAASNGILVNRIRRLIAPSVSAHNSSKPFLLVLGITLLIGSAIWFAPKVVVAQSIKALSETEVQFSAPFDTPVLVNPYGEIGNMIGIRAPEINSEVRTVLSGKVTDARQLTANSGYVVTIQHTKDMFSAYQNLQAPVINVGDTIEEGTVIGYLGGDNSLPQDILQFRVGVYQPNGTLVWIDPTERLGLLSLEIYDVEGQLLDESIAPHAFQMIKDELVEKLGSSALNKNLKVYSSLNAEAQQAAYNATLISPMSTIETQVALVSIDPTSGGIVALIGGHPDLAETTGNKNRALTSYEVGSTFKPIIYATAFEEIDLNQSSILVDEPMSVLDSGIDYQIENHDNTFIGKATIRHHLNISRTVPSMKLLDYVSINSIANNAKLLGYTNAIDKSVLAQLAVKASPLQVTAAYAAFANAGIYTGPYIIDRIEDANGKQLFKQEQNQRRVWTAQTAYQILDALNGNVIDLKNGSTSFSSRANIPGHWVGGKTGTSNSSTVIWFAGITPDLVTTVWMGKDNGQAIPRRLLTGDIVNSSRQPNYVWKDFTEVALDKLDISSTDFPVPEGIEFKTIDLITGKVAEIGILTALPIGSTVE